MSTVALHFVNVFFLIFHTLLIVFNCFGWAWRRTRKWNLITLAVTAFSWLVMGLKYGIGYCICTDWHFQARRALGYIDTEGSYIDFILRLAVGWTPDPAMTRTMAGVVFTISIVLSVALNIRDRSQQKGKSNLGITVI